VVDVAAALPYAAPGTSPWPTIAAGRTDLAAFDAGVLDLHGTTQADGALC
jgi:hypothetical protein